MPSVVTYFRRGVGSQTRPRFRGGGGRHEQFPDGSNLVAPDTFLRRGSITAGTRAGRGSPRV